MRFIISGREYEIRTEQILEAAQGIPPDPPDKRYKYYVEIRGRQYPIKQLIHLVTRLPSIGFNAGNAHHVLEKLGFEIRMFGVDRTPQLVEGPISDTARFAITLEQDEGGFIVASCPALPGCHSQGRTREEAIANVKEAIRGYLASMLKHGERIPRVKEVQEVEVPV